MPIFFTDGKDLEGISKTNDIHYMIVLKYALNILGAWPEAEIGEPKPRFKTAFVLARLLIFAVCIPAIVSYVRINNHEVDFFLLGHVYITLFMNIAALSRQFLPLLQGYRDVTANFVTKLHLFNHRMKSEYAMKTHIMVHKLSHFYTTYSTSLCACGIVMFNMLPMVNNIINGVFTAEEPVYELAVYYSVPWVDLERDMKGFVVITVFNWFISILCSAAFVCLDLHLSLMIFHLWGHVKILKHELITFPVPANSSMTYNTEEEEKIFERLKKVVDYHRFIVTFADSMTSTFGVMLAIFYGYHQVTGCLLLLECSQMEAKSLLRYGPLTLIMFQQLIQLSCVFEMLGSQSERLKDAAYNVPWENMDSRNRMVAGFLLKRLQTPISVKAMGVTGVGVQTMAAVLKTSFSYFAFLRSRGAH